MKVEVSYTLHGDTEDGEFLSAVTEINRVLGGAIAVEGPDLEEVEEIELEDGDTEGAGAAPGGWTAKRADKFVRFLTTDARKAVRYMAAHAPEVEVTDVIEHLGLESGLALGGRMSSVGHAMRRMPKGMDWPIERQYGTYYIDEQVAKLLTEAIESYVSRHAA